MTSTDTYLLFVRFPVFNTIHVYFSKQTSSIHFPTKQIDLLLRISRKPSKFVVQLEDVYLKFYFFHLQNVILHCEISSIVNLVHFPNKAHIQTLKMHSSIEYELY